MVLFTLLKLLGILHFNSSNLLSWHRANKFYFSQFVMNDFYFYFHSTIDEKTDLGNHFYLFIIIFQSNLLVFIKQNVMRGHLICSVFFWWIYQGSEVIERSPQLVKPHLFLFTYISQTPLKSQILLSQVTCQKRKGKF